VLHLAFLMPALGVVLGTFFLAKETCLSPKTAALACILTPVFMVSATNIMCDVMMLAFWVWAVFFWIRGTNRGGFSCLLLSGVLMSACCMTKYYGLSLIPLLGIYSFLKFRRPGMWLVFLMIPVLCAGLYQWITMTLYGRGMLAGAADYAFLRRTHLDTLSISTVLTALGFTGGCVSSVLFFAPLMWKRRFLVLWIGLFLILLCCLPMLKMIGRYPLYEGDGFRWAYALQFSMFAVAGLSLIFASIRDLNRARDADSLLLFLWILGTLVFAGFINWTINARSILPMVPAAGILIARAIERAYDPAGGFRGLRSALPLALAAVLSVAVTWTDYTFANTARDAARQIHEEFGDKTGNLWFMGHWGFQHYMEEAGAKALDRKRSKLSSGDLVIVPDNNSYPFKIPEARVQWIRDLSFTPCRWMATMRMRPVGAGYYSSGWGSLPFVFGAVPDEQYHVFCVKD